jgi:hypothetical protein
MGRHLKGIRRQYKHNRRERLIKKKKESVFIEVHKDHKTHQEERSENMTSQLDNGIANGNKTSVAEMDRNVANDWLYINMIKYFKKKNGFLKFKKVIEKPK